MKNLLIDLWNDLRAKRLWPVALVLLAALVATPVVLSKKAEEPEPAPATPAAATPAEPKGPEGPAELAEVKLEALAEGSGSSLSSFDPRNPFAPPKKALEAARRTAAGSAPSTATSGGAGSGFSVGSSGPSDVISSGGATGVDVTPDSGAVTMPDTSGGGTPDTGGDTPDSAEPKTTEYTYVVDVAFRANDRHQTVKGMEKLDILPDAASPLLIFMGVTPKAGNAVFLVDSTLDAAGEGHCKPNPAECAFLYLGPGSEHEFTTDEGDSYTLRVDEIRRVKVGAKASASKLEEQDRQCGRRSGAPLRPAAPRRPGERVQRRERQLKQRQGQSIGGKAMRRLFTICLLALSATALLVSAPAASTAESKKASKPSITRVLPMRVGVGGTLTITGKNFKSARSANTVIFRAPNGRSAFAKPRRASRGKLKVVVPGAVSRLLAGTVSSPSPPGSSCACSPASSAASLPAGCRRS